MGNFNSNQDDQQSKKKEDLLGKVIDHPEEVDSKANIDYSKRPDGKSLTNDEDADVDPNEVDDKPTFNGNK